jgi:hypothetical protein
MNLNLKEENGCACVNLGSQQPCPEICFKDLNPTCLLFGWIVDALRHQRGRDFL